MFIKAFQRALKFRLKKSYPTNIYDVSRCSAIAINRPYSDEVRRAQASSVSSPGPTIFDKIISKEIKADIIYEDELCLAFNDVNPQAPIHFLVIPKRRIHRLQDAKVEDKEVGISELFTVLFTKAGNAEIVQNKKFIIGYVHSCSFMKVLTDFLGSVPRLKTGPHLFGTQTQNGTSFINLPT